MTFSCSLNVLILSLSLQDINNFNFINITFCYSEYMPIWDGLTSGYNLLMMVSLMFFAFQNSRISAHGLKDFKAEGIASYRVLILLLFLSALLLIVRLIFLFDNPLKYERLFWQQVTVSFLPPTLYVAVISFPKVCNEGFYDLLIVNFLITVIYFCVCVVFGRLPGSQKGAEAEKMEKAVSCTRGKV